MLGFLTCMFSGHIWRKAWDYHTGNQCARCGHWDQER